MKERTRCDCRSIFCPERPFVVQYLPDLVILGVLLAAIAVLIQYV